MGIKSFFKKIAESINEHTVVDDFEANLYPPGGGMFRKSGGELEFTHFKPGHMTFEIEIKQSANVPAGEEVAILIHGVEVYRLAIEDQYKTEVKLYSKQGDTVPPIKLGDSAEITHNGEVILAGVFKHDD